MKKTVRLFFGTLQQGALLTPHPTDRYRLDLEMDGDRVESASIVGLHDRDRVPVEVETKPYSADELALAAQNVREAVEVINHSAAWLADRGYSVEVTSIPFTLIGQPVHFNQFSAEISTKVVL